MARRRTVSSLRSPCKSKGVIQKGYRHFSCKHYKLVSSKYPFLQALQIKSRVKKLWNRLPQCKKEEYAHSPEKIKPASPKKFSIKCRLSPDLNSSPLKSQDTINWLPNSIADKRPLRKSWKTYLDTSHRVSEIFTSDNYHVDGKHTGILVKHSEDKPRKSKSKKARVTFEPYPRKELFATDAAPAEISQGLDHEKLKLTKSVEENANRNHSSAEFNVHYLDGVSPELGGVAAEICVTTTSDQIEVEQIVNGVFQEKFHQDVICRETGEVEIPVTTGLHIAEEIGGENQEDGIGQVKDGNEQQVMGVTDSECALIRLDSDQLRQVVSCSNGVNVVNKEIGGSCIEHGSAGQKVVGIADHTTEENKATNQDVTRNCNSDVMKSSSEIDMHHGATTEEKISLVQTTTPYASPDDISDESGVVAQILAELGIIIAEEISPERRNRRALQLQQQEDPRTNESENDEKCEDVLPIIAKTNFSCGTANLANKHGEMTTSNSPNALIAVSNSEKDATHNIAIANELVSIDNDVLLQTGSKDDTSVSYNEETKKESGKHKKQMTLKIPTPSQRRSARLNHEINDEIKKVFQSPKTSDKNCVLVKENNSPIGALRRSPRNHVSSLAHSSNNTSPNGSGNGRRQRRLTSFPKGTKNSPTPANKTATTKKSPIGGKKDKFAGANYNIFEFVEEIPNHKVSPPKPRFTSPMSISSKVPRSASLNAFPVYMSSIVPRCPSSGESCTSDKEKPSQLKPSPVWVDSTAKRLVEKGMLSKKYKEKRAKEVYDLDSNKNTTDFAGDTQICKNKRQVKKKKRSGNRDSFKYAKKSKKDMFERKPCHPTQPKRKCSDRSKKCKEQANSKPKERAMKKGGVIRKTSTPQHAEDELKQAVQCITSDLNMERCATPFPIPNCLEDEDIIEEERGFFEARLSPISMVNNSCDSWMYYDHGNPDFDSSSDDDNDDDFLSPRRKRSGAIHGPVAFSSSQNLCKRFTEFCANLSQESSQESSYQSIDVDDEEALELTHNAVTLSLPYSHENCEGGRIAAHPDMDQSSADFSEDEPQQQMESAALCAIQEVFTSSMDSLDNAGMETTDQGTGTDPEMVNQLEQVIVADMKQCVQQSQQNFSDMLALQQHDIVNTTNAANFPLTKLLSCQTEDYLGEAPIGSQEEVNEVAIVQDLAQEGDCWAEELEDADGADYNREPGDIIEEALKISGISGDSVCATTVINPITTCNPVEDCPQGISPDLGGEVDDAEDVVQDLQCNNIFHQVSPSYDHVVLPTKDCVQHMLPVNTKVVDSVDGSPDTGNVLLNMFHQVSPSPPRVNHLPTPRSSGRRLLVSNRVETTNNFSQLFDQDDIFL